MQREPFEPILRRRTRQAFTEKLRVSGGIGQCAARTAFPARGFEREVIAGPAGYLYGIGGADDLERAVFGEAAFLPAQFLALLGG